MPVVASTGLAGLLTGPVRVGTVVGAGPAAAYVVVDEVARADGPGVVAIEASGAVGLPCGLGLTDRAPGWLPSAVAVGAAARVGAGRVDVDGVVLRVARWRPTRPRLPEVTGGTLRARVDVARGQLPGPADPIADRVADRTDALAHAAARADLGAALTAVTALCGLGEGSTPSGDDVVAGAVAAGALLGTATTGAVGPPPGWWSRLGARAAAHAPGRTTTLASALLGHAVRGEVADPVAGLLHALAGDRPVADAMGRLLAVGHRSGADLARGVLLAADLAAPRAHARVPEAVHA